MNAAYWMNQDEVNERAEHEEDQYCCYACGFTWNSIDTSECPREECPSCGSEKTNLNPEPVQ